MPVVGVGLFYRSGYFRQSLTADGRQQESYPAFNPHELPFELVRDGGRKPLSRCACPTACSTPRSGGPRSGGRRCCCWTPTSTRTARRAGGHRPPVRRWGEHRLRQEILLGIGGVRALHALGIEPEVFHTNEGHAGFLGLERIRRLIQERGLDAATAVETVRAAPSSPPTRRSRPASTASRGRSSSATSASTGSTPASGSSRSCSSGPSPTATTRCSTWPSWACGLAQRANGVSRLHGQVSRDMFRGLWSGFEVAEVPIGHVTNGVHAGTWVNGEFTDLRPRRADFRISTASGAAGRHSRRGHLAGPADCPRAARRRRARPAEAGLAGQGIERGPARLDRPGLRPRRADRRVRPSRPPTSVSPCCWRTRSG